MGRRDHVFGAPKTSHSAKPFAAAKIRVEEVRAPEAVHPAAPTVRGRLR